MYTDGNMKLAIVYVCLFKAILKKCNFHEEQEVAQLLLDDLQKEYDELDMRASAHGKKFKQELNKAQKEVKVYVDTAFKYFQDLLNESLVQEWNQVCMKPATQKDT